MEAYLSLTRPKRADACRQSEAVLGLPAGSLEKDFWVTWLLRELFSLPEVGGHLTFKGGTSLSKGWGLIERFSEDLDVVVDRTHLGFGGQDFSAGQLNKLRRACQRFVQGELRGVLHDRLKEKLAGEKDWDLALATKDQDPDQQTLFFHYPSEFGGAMRYIKPAVKIELGARSDIDPSEQPALRCLLAHKAGPLEGMTPFAVRTVAPRRTFWEKAMLLHEETQRPPDKELPRRLSRHYYDLWCLERAGVAREAWSDEDLFDRVAAHRKVFFNHRWVDYDTLRPGSLRLLPSAARLPEWQRDYRAMQEEMFYGQPPKFEQVLQVMETLEAQIRKMR